MKITKYISVAVLAVFFAACAGNDNNASNSNTDEAAIAVDKEAFLKDLEVLESKINAELESPTEEDLKKAITTYQDFAGLFPEDPKAPDYLMKAADFAHTTGQYQKSVKILNRIINDYPSYSKMEDVKFTRASHLDFELRDTTAAKTAYKEFIAAYPNSDLVKDAESRIEFIAYSMEELTNMWMEKLEKEEK